VTVILDAGALVAAERRPGGLLAILDELAVNGHEVPAVPSTVIAQVWRGGRGRQARLGKWLSLCETVVLDHDAALRVGQLLAATRTTDVVDAHVVDSASQGDVIVTSDPLDIAKLAKTAKKRVSIIAL